jgi:hypothetical protein
MSCLLELCFIAAIYIDGGIGQQMTVDYNDENRTNAYGVRIGEVSLITEFTNGMYIGVKHISGIDTREDDYGINAIMIGAKIYLFKGK